MPDRRFFAVACPFCREYVFAMPPMDGPVIVREGATFSIATTASEDLVEVVGSRSTSEAPTFHAAHRCPSLRLMPTPEERDASRAAAIEMLAAVSPSAAELVARLTGVTSDGGRK